MSTILCMCATVLIVTGCATSTTPLLVDASPKVPVSLLQPCPPLVPLEGISGADVLRKLVEVGQMYNDCVDSMGSLIEAVR